MGRLAVNEPTSNSQPSAPPAGTRRRWYRFHWSTCIVIAAILTVLVLLNGPGRANNLGISRHPICYEHGWPFVYLDRFVLPTAQGRSEAADHRSKQLLPWAEMPFNRGSLNSEECPPWMDGDNWTYAGQWQICRTGMLLDIVGTAVCVAVLAAAYETWRRRRWRYSLRFLLASIFAFAVIMAFWRAATNGVEKEFQAAAALEEKGFGVSVECDAPVFQRMLVGAYRLDVFKHVCDITYVKSRSNSIPVTDADLQRIGELRHLRCLGLDDMPLTDRSVECVRGLADLEVLGLDNSQITDAGLKSIHDLPRLRVLFLRNTKVTGEGFKFLRNLPQLEDLSLNNSPIVDDSLSRLAMLPQIRKLNLTNTEVTDTGLQHLEGARLNQLFLGGTKITDSGLRCLENISELKVVGIEGTGVTADGVERLERALPNCGIGWDKPKTR